MRISKQLLMIFLAGLVSVLMAAPSFAGFLDFGWAFKVDGVSYPKGKFKDEFEAQVKQYNAEYKVNLKEDDAKLKQARQNFLNQKISFQLIENEAKKRNITVKDNEIDAKLDEVKASLTEQKQDLNKMLKERGMTLKDAKNEIRTQLLLQKFVDSLAGNVTVTDAEAKKYFNENKDRLSQMASGGANHGPLKYEYIKESLKGILLQNKKSLLVQQWVADSRAKAKIEIAKEFQ